MRKKILLNISIFFGVYIGILVFNVLCVDAFQDIPAATYLHAVNALVAACGAGVNIHLLLRLRRLW